jgi:hypothetical protein
VEITDYIFSRVDFNPQNSHTGTVPEFAVEADVFLTSGSCILTLTERSGAIDLTFVENALKLNNVAQDLKCVRYIGRISCCNYSAACVKCDSTSCACIGERERDFLNIARQSDDKTQNLERVCKVNETVAVNITPRELKADTAQKFTFSAADNPNTPDNAVFGNRDFIYIACKPLNREQTSCNPYVRHFAFDDGVPRNRVSAEIRR